MRFLFLSLFIVASAIALTEEQKKNGGADHNLPKRGATAEASASVGGQAAPSAPAAAESSASQPAAPQPSAPEPAPAPAGPAQPTGIEHSQSSHSESSHSSSSIQQTRPVREARKTAESLDRQPRGASGTVSPVSESRQSRSVPIQQGYERSNPMADFNVRNNRAARLGESHQIRPARKTDASWHVESAVESSHLGP